MAALTQMVRVAAFIVAGRQSRYS